jgi:hypothetical protein
VIFIDKQKKTNTVNLNGMKIKKNPSAVGGGIKVLRGCSQFLWLKLTVFRVRIKKGPDQFLPGTEG